MATYLTGPQVTGIIEQAERRVDIPNELYWLRPNIDPVAKLAMGRDGKGLPVKKRAAINPEFKVIEKQPHALWSAINEGSNYTAGDTELTLDDVSFIKARHVLVDASTDEMMLVSAVNYSTKVVTVGRAFGVTAAATISDGDPIYNLGSANEEFAAVPGALTIKNRVRTNYLEIVRWPVALSGTLQASGLYTGQKESELNMEAFYEIRVEIERKFLFSEPSEDLTGGPGGYPIRTVGGLKYWIETGGGHTADAGGALTKAEFQTFRRNSTEYTDDNLVMLAPGLLIDGFSTWKDGKLEMRPRDEVYNLNVVEWVDGFGQLFIIHHKELKNSPYGLLTGWGGVAFQLDPRELAYRYLEGNGKNRDLHLRVNVKKDGVDGTTNEYLGEVGLELKMPEKHAEIYGITSVTA